MMPMNLIGSSISQLFYQEASFQFNDGKDVIVLMRKTLNKSIIFATPILIVILFFAPLLFKSIFGKDWEVAGVYAQIIAPWILLDFVRAPLSQVALIFNKQVPLLIISFVSNLILVLVLIYFVNIVLFIL
jgi:O-antigen/teichoic acid export membrane protein